MCGCKKAATQQAQIANNTFIPPVANDSPVNGTAILQYLGANPIQDMRVTTSTRANYRLGANNLFTVFAEDLASFLNMNTGEQTLFQRVT